MKMWSFFIVGLLIISGLAVIGNVTEASETKNLNMNFSAPEINEGTDFVEIEVQGTNSYYFDGGAPKLPEYTQTIVLPFGVKNFGISCEVQQMETKVLTKKISPAPQPTVPGYEDLEPEPMMDVAIYSSAELFPDNWYSYNVGVGLDENMQHKTFLTITMYPVRYKPLLNTIEYVKSISLSINYDDPGYNPFPTTATYDLVIIAPQKFITDLQPLVEHKNNHGVTTTTKTTENIYSEFSGVDKPEQIKKFIQYALEEYGTKYILLVGGLNNMIYADPMDTENYGVKWWNVPVRWSNLDEDEPGPICDLYYADVYKKGGEFDNWNANGNDLIGEWNFKEKPDCYPDVALGRLACVNKNEVRSVVDKIINYENNAYNSNWFKKMIVVAGDGFMDQEELDFQWNTNGLSNGDYTIYAQSNNDEQEFGPIEEINIKIDKTQATKLTFNHDDYTRIPNYPHYPYLPIAEVVSVSEGDIIGNTDFFYEPNDGEAYINDMLHWANVEYKSEILHIRGKSYDPKPYGNLTDMHVWIKNSNDQIIFDQWKYGYSGMFAEGEWTTGEKMLLGRAGALYYMPDTFVKQKIWSSLGTWYGLDDVKNAISQGSGFIFFSGHGSPAVWANHYPGIPGNRQIGDVEGLRVTEMVNGLPKFTMKELTNDYKLPVCVVGGCHNSFFAVSLIPSFLDLYDPNHNMFTYGLPTPECWSWMPVGQSKSGFIASIGNTGYGSGYLGENCNSGGLDNWVTTEFFVQYGTEGKDILGEAHAQAITNYQKEIKLRSTTDAKAVQQWVLLGDPSLKIGGYPPQQTITITAKGKPGFNPGDTIELKASGGTSYDWSLDMDGDGVFDTFLTGQTIQEEWNSPGVYWVKVASGGVSGLTVVEIENQGPNKPSIDGPTNLEVGQTCTYNIGSSDPDGDDLYYFIEWGDGKYTIVEPGQSTTVTHKFTKSSKITVKAIDSEGLWNEASLSVTVPKTKQGPNSMPFVQLLNKLLERFPNLFPILRQIIEMVN